MASLSDRYWQVRGKIGRAFVVRFKDRAGRHRSFQFKELSNAQKFLEQVLVKEEMWRAERRLCIIEQEASDA